MKTKPKRKPQDATLRNIRALKKRVAHLEDVVNFHNYLIEKHTELIEEIQRLISKIKKGKRSDDE